MKNAWEGDLGSPKTAAGKRNTRHSLLTCDATGVFAQEVCASNRDVKSGRLK